METRLLLLILRGVGITQYNDEAAAWTTEVRFPAGLGIFLLVNAS